MLQVVTIHSIALIIKQNKTQTQIYFIDTNAQKN